jgi:NADH dehydrogenase (ubiquinone) 1 beta subcomplex subunit 8
MPCLPIRPVLRSVRPKQLAQAILSRQYATPVEYKPQEKDPQLGDYPQLPFVSTQLRSPLGWWDVQMRRNYGEVASFLAF